MLVAHTSDLHGDYSQIVGCTEDVDLWIWTGDMLPNWGRPGLSTEVRIKEVGRQRDYIYQHSQDFHRVMGDKTVLVVDGNHDFIDVGKTLRDVGLDAVSVGLDPVEVAGFKFVGFSAIPYILGEWNGELDQASLLEISREAVSKDPDILLTHAPPKGVLSHVPQYNATFGIDGLLNLVLYSPTIRYHMFGHVHECGCRTEERGNALFSNAAKGINFIEVE